MEKFFKCGNCFNVGFEDELLRTKTTYEQYYGVTSLFDNRTPLYLMVCPHCESDEIVMLSKEELTRGQKHELGID